jgi:protoporphyrin/coproporphyrin ferrochelatase
MKTTVLLVNLGTPDSASTSDVRTYLTEFLNDERVIDINAIARFLIVNGIIVPFRAPKSAALYKHIFTDEGSPLMFHGLALQKKMQEVLGDDYIVEFAMRYRKPSLKSVLARIQKNGTHKIIVVPLFPQYASSSTGSTLQKVYQIISKWQTMPSVNVVHQFHDDPGFLDAFVENGKKFNMEEYDHVVFSFHGLPQRHIRKGDCHNHCLKDGCCDTLSEKNYSCYRAGCFSTARTIATRLNIPTSKYTISFQSRLGRDPWIKPYTDDELKQLAHQGVKKVLCFSPAFVADCLETIHEIGTEYDELFQEHGGEKVQLVPSLNSNDTWVEALKNIVLKAV